MELQRVVITGMGVVTALGQTVGALWEALTAGRSGIDYVTRFDTSDFTVKFGGEVKDFDPTPFFEGKQVHRVDRFSQFAVAAASRAIESAGLPDEHMNPTRCGVIIGSGIGGLNEFEQQHTRLLQKGADRVSPFMIPKLMVNAASAQVSISYGFKGPNLSVSSACASGGNAIGEACRIIQRGEADVMVAGGTEAALTPIGLSGFASMKALSTRNDAPQQASRPFEKNRDGFVLAEGAGVVVLERFEHARQRGAPVLAEIVGYGATADAMHIAASDPKGNGAAEAMRLALAEARIEPDKLDYINAHGTATLVGDISECTAIKAALGAAAAGVPVSSTKSMLGHLLGAAGGVEFVISVLSIRNNVLPPTINYQEPDPDCDLDFVPNEAREVDCNFVMTTAFGFGGHNVALIIKAT